MISSHRRSQCPISIRAAQRGMHSKSRKFARILFVCHNYQKQALTELPAALELRAKACAEGTVIVREFDLSGDKDGWPVDFGCGFCAARGCGLSLGQRRYMICFPTGADR